MPISFDPKVSQHFLSSPIFQASPPSHFVFDGKSTLSSEKKSKTSFWYYLTLPIVTIFLWISDLFGGCCGSMFTPSRLDILEDALDEPEKKGAEYAKNPIETATQFVLAILEDPIGFSQLCTDHREKWIHFLKVFKSRCSELPFENVSKNFTKTAQSLFCPHAFSETSLGGQLRELLKNNPETVRQAAIRWSQKVAAKIPSHAESGAIDLKNFFRGMSILLKNMKKEKFSELLDSLNAATNAKMVHQAIVDIIPEKMENKEEFEKALEESFESKGLAFKQVQDANLAKTFLGLSSPINLELLFITSLFPLMSKKQFNDLASILKDDFPFGSKMALAFKEIAGEKTRMSEIGNNLIDASLLLKSCYDDYLSPTA